MQCELLSKRNYSVCLFGNGLETQSRTSDTQRTELSYDLGEIKWWLRAEGAVDLERGGSILHILKTYGRIVDP